MSRKYNYSRTVQTQYGSEKFSATECDSFDEALNMVEKGIRDRLLQIEEIIKAKIGDTEVSDQFEVAEPETVSEEPTEDLWSKNNK
jgi:hypothetical protein